MLVDGTGKEPIEDAAVVIKGNRIIEVGPRDAVKTKESMNVIKAEGMTILPGLIDAHVHIMNDPNILDPEIKRTEPVAIKVLKGASYLREYLKAGFTTIREAGSPHPFVMDLSAALRTALIPGPRMITSGYIAMTGRGKPSANYKFVTGPVEARRAAREYISAGVEWIKVGASGGIMAFGGPLSVQLTVEEMKAAVDEAHNAGLKAWSHACGSQSFINSIEVGVDTVEHGYYLNNEAISSLVASGIPWGANLAVTYQPVVYQPGKYGFKEVPSAFKKMVKEAEDAEKAHKESFRKALKAGAKIIVGTDAGSMCDQHGCGGLELELMVKYGMSTMDALVACTRKNAEALGIADELGTVEAGKLADITVVQGNPLKDIKLIKDKKNIRVVIKGGETVAKNGELTK